MFSKNIGVEVFLNYISIHRFRWKGVLVGVGGLLLISLAVTAIIIGVYNPDVLEAEGLELGWV